MGIEKVSDQEFTIRATNCSESSTVKAWFEFILGAWGLKKGNAINTTCSRNGKAHVYLDSHSVTTGHCLNFNCPFNTEKP
jgi:hypothetical protein